MLSYFYRVIYAYISRFPYNEILQKKEGWKKEVTIHRGLFQFSNHRSITNNWIDKIDNSKIGTGFLKTTWTKSLFKEEREKQ